MDHIQTNRRKFVLVALLLGLIGIVYAPVLESDFIRFDDTAYVTTNLHVMRGLTWDDVRWAFRSAYQCNWHPLTWMSHMLDVELFGMRPGWHHLTNLLLHSANSVLLLFFFFRLTGKFARSGFTAALFALHPLHVESVAWIAERKDMLSTFFFLLTLLAYAAYARGKVAVRAEAENKPTAVGGHRRAFYYTAALGFFTLALLSKPMVVTLPFVLLLVDYWPLARFELTARGLANILPLVLEKTPFFILAAALSVVTFLVQKSGNAVVNFLPFSSRAANALVSYFRYLAKTVWPSHLAIYYPHPAITPFGSPSWPVLEIAALAVLLGTISACVWLARSRRPWLLMGWLWYLGTLVPVVGLVQVGGQAMADRYTYIPLIGIFAALVWLGAEAMERLVRYKPVLVGLALSIIALGSLCTHKQVEHWRTSQAVFEHAISVTQSNALAHMLLGEDFLGQRKTNLALIHFQRALEYNPGLAEIYFEFGSYYEGEQRTDDAIRAYETTLAYRPWLDLARRRLAALLLKSGRREEALAQCRESARRNPGDAEAHINLGGALWKLGQKAEALSEYEEAVRLDPMHPVAHYNLGLALAAQSRLAEAEAEYTEAIHLNRYYTDALIALGRTLTLLGRLSEAPAPFRKLAKLQPTNAEFQVNLGTALVLANRTNEAAEAFATALRLQPALPHELVQKAEALLRQGHRDAAIAQATTASRLQPNFPEARSFLDSVNRQSPTNP